MIGWPTRPRPGAALNHALALAAPGGWIRPFVEMGPAMAALLRGLEPRHPQHAFAVRLLAQFPAETAQTAHNPTEPMIEPLTRRELEILRLLAARLTNQEIASRLVVSPATVKRRTANIYQKLHVNGRRHAVAKARTTGYLPPT
ncbi:MAG: LuxR C-terminal-related transcriptional regulator [Caldilineaceae bacterium]